MSTTTIHSSRRSVKTRVSQNRLRAIGAKIALLRLSWTQRHRLREYTIVCESGIVWVTAENDAHDYFVHAGETLCLLSQGRIVAQGLGRAKFKVCEQS